MEYQVMSMLDAIQEAENDYRWGVRSDTPVSVNVQFLNQERQLDQTQLDLYADDKKTELIELWKSLHEELGADLDSIIRVESQGTLC